MNVSECMWAVKNSSFPLVPLPLVTEFTTGWTPSSNRSDFYGEDHLWATIADLNGGTIQDTKSGITDLAVQARGNPVKSDEGDLLFSFKLSVGQVAIVNRPMFTNEAIATFKPSENLYVKFAYYAFPVYLTANANTNIYGAPLLNSELISKSRVPLLPLDTQRRIADYLDSETAQIDTLVAELDEYVELLERRKESLSKEIIDGLTKDFKDVQCKFIVDTTTGSGDTQDATQEGEYPFYVRSDHIESATEWTFDTDAVLTSGDGAGVGKIYHLASGKFHAHQRVYVMRNFRQAIPEYYYWAFKQRFTESIQYGGAKSTVESVRMNMITDLKIPLPDLDTQRRIADYLDEETAKTDTIITQCRELKELLLKRRQVLITDVVTGKVEV